MGRQRIILNVFLSERMLRKWKRLFLIYTKWYNEIGKILA